MNQPLARRSALARLGIALSSALGAVLSAPAVIYLLDPLRRRREAARPPIPVARFGEVPDLDKGGSPLRAVVVQRDARDAWSRQPRARLGAVWLYRRGPALTCLSTTCPHAGCAVDYDAQAGGFRCPCHDSRFAIDGRRQEGPSPRDMDALEFEIKDDEVLCHFQRFRPAVPDKEPA